MRGILTLFQVVINNLLDIKKLEDGKVEIINNDMNPVRSMEVCVDMFSKQAERKKIEMIYNVSLHCGLAGHRFIRKWNFLTIGRFLSMCRIWWCAITIGISKC